jgi:hypothetical protein
MENEIEKECKNSNQNLSPAGEKAIFMFQPNMLESSGDAFIQLPSGRLE